MCSAPATGWWLLLCNSMLVVATHICCDQDATASRGIARACSAHVSPLPAWTEGLGVRQECFETLPKPPSFHDHLHVPTWPDIHIKWSLCRATSTASGSPETHTAATAAAAAQQTRKNTDDGIAWQAWPNTHVLHGTHAWLHNNSTAHPPCCTLPLLTCVLAEAHNGLLPPPLELAIWGYVLCTAGLSTQHRQVRHTAGQLGVAPHLTCSSNNSGCGGCQRLVPAAADKAALL